ncbi:hypothetical protein [Mumia zhuanghuii]|uniref:Uncharacterized protein n=1 Tax=Mumia zhuanghuii TaxID=2585211 RepID=A0A5C4MIK3_9ACTN|nr:hypothetical protein [Mumia zhuanghuii]TNC29838.1 hypothetical protein FHE65_33320 [Mumia zhuanghuii]TNC37113.1 hypothetical protein FHE65_25405 [Mumia zhuanghuii]
MDILRPGGTFWRIARRRRSDFGQPLPWMPELAGGAAAPPTASEPGWRPIVVTRNGAVVRVEPAPGRRETPGRIKEIAAAVYALPSTASTADDPSHAPYQPHPGPATTGGWGAPGQGNGGGVAGGE